LMFSFPPMIQADGRDGPPEGDFEAAAPLEGDHERSRESDHRADREPESGARGFQLERERDRPGQSEHLERTAEDHPRFRQIRERIEHLEQAVHNLREAGMGEQADQLMHRVEQMRREIHPHPESDRAVHAQLHEMRMEIHRLRQGLDELRHVVRILVERERGREGEGGNAGPPREGDRWRPPREGDRDHANVGDKESPREGARDALGPPREGDRVRRIIRPDGVRRRMREGDHLRRDGDVAREGDGEGVAPDREN